MGMPKEKESIYRKVVKQIKNTRLLFYFKKNLSAFQSTKLNTHQVSVNNFKFCGLYFFFKWIINQSSIRNTKLTLCFSFILSFFSSIEAQNLVPNSGFENFANCPTGSCQWFEVNGWNNVNGSTGCTSSVGSPDFFHTCGSSFFTFPITLNGRVNPFAGNAVMGLATWLGSFSDFREYLSIPLTSPLQTGNLYMLNFAYTNGEFDPAASYGGNGTELGVHFSVNPLSQAGSNPIILTPTYETTTPLFSTTWQTVSFMFVATDNHTHITIGNFRNDANTAVQEFATPSNSTFPYAYYLSIILKLRKS
ncbi:MAG: hypothetical protein HC912_05860 [Saprospiraceae bacterium]|nr:hypothetical protein [Saprospiraceae bacterium]